MLGWRAGFKPGQLPELVCVWSALNCAEEDLSKNVCRREAG